MPRRITDETDCRSCDNYRWVTRRCVLDRDDVYEGGLLCREWTPIRIIQRKSPYDK